MTAPAWIALAALVFTNLIGLARALIRHGERKRNQEQQESGLQKLEASIGARFDGAEKMMRERVDQQAESIDRLEGSIVERLKHAEQQTSERMDKLDERLGELRQLVASETSYLRGQLHRAGNINTHLLTRVAYIEEKLGLPVAPGLRDILDGGVKIP